MLPARQIGTEPMPRGDFGIKRTLDVMESLVREGVRSPLVIQTARSLIAHVPEKSPGLEANTLFDFVKDRVRYTRDPIGVELLRGPERLLQEIVAEGRAIGDCDELSTLLAALLRAIGINTRFKIVSRLGPTPSLIRDSQFQHVYLEALIGTKWVPLDPTAKTQRMGYAPFGYSATYRGRGEGMSYHNSGYETASAKLSPRGPRRGRPQAPWIGFLS